jgi:hypothetical protein
MQKALDDIIKEVRIAIDEIAKDNDDDFMQDQDTEIRYAILAAANQVLLEAPAGFLRPEPVTVGANNDYDAAQTQFTDGHGSVVLPDNFLKLFEFKLISWQSSVRELMDPGSQEAKMQASTWSRGTPQKPKAMLTTDANGNRVLMYWTAGRYTQPPSSATNNVFNHTIEAFYYIPTAEIVDVTPSDGTAAVQTLKVALTDSAENNLIYRAAALFLEGKKEKDLSERMRQLSKFN